MDYRTGLAQAKDPLRNPHRTAHGFTLIELLVVVAIIVVLIAMLMPSLQKAREQAGRAACLSNMHQLYLGHVMYGEDNYRWIVVQDYLSALTVTPYDCQPHVSNPPGYPNIQNVYGDSVNGYLYHYVSPGSKVYKCPGSFPADSIINSKPASWYTGPAAWAMRWDNYNIRYTGTQFPTGAVLPMIFDYIYGGGNTSDATKQSNWHGNKLIPVMMSDGHGMIWHPTAGLAVPTNGPSYDSTSEKSFQQMYLQQ